MVTTKIDISKSNGALLQLLAIVRAGEIAILMDGETPVAQVTPLQTMSGKRVPGLNKGAFEIIGDFDAPLPDEFWLGEQ
jgi:antitoxin (DNA-binding transcriptional repressor) of toxin-antitoxin stability system